MEVSKPKVKEQVSKPWYIFAEVRAHLSIYSDNEAHAKQLIVLKSQTKYTWENEKKFETGLMLFDAELHKTVIMQTESYKCSFLGFHPV